MRPLLVSYSDLAGGAARAAFRLHAALRSQGIDSEMMVRQKVSDDETVHEFQKGDPVWTSPFRGRVERYIQHLQRTPNPVFHSSNVVPTRWSEHFDADVVNLHWIGAGTMSIEDVGRIDVPTVMTLHDMWGFCGAEHYATERPDARWATGYTRENRPEGHRGFDIDRWTWERKRRHWKPMTVVAPSRWLADCVSRSELMAEWPVHVVPYALDLTVFRPQDKAAARRSLGLPSDANVVLFGAMGGGSDPRKGYDLLVDALTVLVGTQERILGVIFGQEEPEPRSESGLPLRWMGHIADDHSLATLYSAADVMVVPSRQDNLPQTGTEAQACGTPVVGFRTSGLPDVVEHEETGFLAEPFSAEALADAVKWVLADRHRRVALGRAARERALRIWSPSVIASSYRDVYAAAITRAHHRPSRGRRDG